MIYLNDAFKSAGTLNQSRTDQRDYEIDNRINIDIISLIFKKYSVITTPPKSGQHHLKIKNTIINIYQHRDDIQLT